MDVAKVCIDSDSLDLVQGIEMYKIDNWGQKQDYFDHCWRKTRGFFWFNTISKSEVFSRFLLARNKIYKNLMNVFLLETYSRNCSSALHVKLQNSISAT